MNSYLDGYNYVQSNSLCDYAKWEVVTICYNFFVVCLTLHLANLLLVKGFLMMEAKRSRNEQLIVKESSCVIVTFVSDFGWYLQVGSVKVGSPQLVYFVK